MKKYLVFTDNFFSIFKFYLPVSLDTFDEMLKRISWFIGKGVTKTDSVYDKNGQEILVFNLTNFTQLFYSRIFGSLIKYDTPEYHNLVTNIKSKEIKFYYFFEFAQIRQYFYKERINLTKYLDVIKFVISSEIEIGLNNKNAKILLHTATECIGYPTIFYWDYFYKIVKRPPEDFILLVGDARITTHTVIPTIYDRYWERFSSHHIKKYTEDIAIKIKNIKTKKQVKWYGLCLNRITKSHRTIMAKFFDENLKDKINYSYGLEHSNLGNWSEMNSDIFDKFVSSSAGDVEKLYKWPGYNFDEYNIDVKEIKEWMKFHGEKFSDGDICDMNINMTHQMCPESYFNSYFNIVCESNIRSSDELTTFLSEKTFKPILWYQPFIIVGQPYSIDTLKKDGYDVFEDIIDHSYDTVSPLAKRIEMVQHEITRLCSISKEEWSEILNNNFLRLHNNFLNLKKRGMQKLRLDHPYYKGEYLK